MAIFHICVWDKDFNAESGGEIVLAREFEADTLEQAIFKAGELKAGDILAAKIRPGAGLLVVRRALAGIVAKIEF